jgi:hypothetical protein
MDEAIATFVGVCNKVKRQQEAHENERRRKYDE